MRIRVQTLFCGSGDESMGTADHSQALKRAGLRSKSNATWLVVRSFSGTSPLRGLPPWSAGAQAFQEH